VAVRTVYSVQKQIKSFYEEHGHRPVGTDFHTENNWLRNTQGSSIFQLCNQMGLPPKKRQGTVHRGRTLVRTKAEVIAYYKRTGKRPTSANMSGVDCWLQRKHGFRLSELCTKMGLPGGWRKSRTLEESREHIMAFYELHGVRPRWEELRGVASYLKKHHGMTLSEYCDQLDLPPFREPRTLEGVKQFVLDHFEVYGARPKSKDFNSIRRWLQRHHGKSLFQLCDEMGLPRRANPLRHRVYWNLHKDLFSVKEHRKNVKHIERFTMEEVSFCVAPAGRQKVLDTGVKNVHAGVTGRFIDNPPLEVVEEWTRVSYNPFRSGYFEDTQGRPCESTEMLSGFIEDGRPHLYAYNITYHEQA